MTCLDDLGSQEVAALTLASFLVIDEVFALSLVGHACQTVARRAVCRLRLQFLGGADPAAALLRVVASSLTDKGASLLELDTSFCANITKDLLRQLPKFPALQRLSLDGCQEVDDEGLLFAAQRCQALQSLSLYWNTRGTDRGFCILLRAQKGRPVSMNFSGCKYLGDDTAQRIASKGSELEFLDLTRCSKMTDAGALVICESLPKLRVLRLYAMAQLDPPAFLSLKRLVHLEELDLCGCRLEDQALLQFLTAAAPSKLHTLNLTWCPALTDAAAQGVARCCPKLTWLSYFGNLNISDASIDALAASACGASLHSLDVRGLTKAPKYSQDRDALLKIFPALVHTDLHH